MVLKNLSYLLEVHTEIFKISFKIIKRVMGRAQIKAQ